MTRGYFCSDKPSRDTTLHAVVSLSHLSQSDATESHSTVAVRATGEEG